MCVYAPNRANERKVFFEFLVPYFQCDRVVVVMGDFNCVCSPEDRASPRDYRDISAEVLTEALEQHFLEDVARARAIRDRLQFTYFQRASQSRLDRIYVSAEAISSTTDYSVTPLFFTDHCLVSVTLGKTKPRRNRFNWQLWKINNTLLKDDDFAKTILEIINKIIATKESCYLEKWEYPIQKWSMVGYRISFVWSALAFWPN